jgi:glycosyltransferase involved in cell wall biosynthesis
MRVLIIAENASTRFGGEAILAHHYFRLLRHRGLDTHLIVHARTREELLSDFHNDQDHLHFVEDQLLQKLFFRLGSLLPHRIAEATFGLANQLLTQAAQRRIIGKLLTPRTVVHQPAPVSPRLPSLMHDVGAPVVIGPLNGGMEFPPAFRNTEARLSRFLIALGRSFSDRVNAFLPGKRRAAIVLVANQRTRAALPSGLQGTILHLPENGVDTELWSAISGTSTPSPNRFVFIGRLVDWKALDIVLYALQHVRDAQLDVIGDGPMLADWKGLAVRLGLSSRVHFHGWLAQADCATFLAASKGLVLPSLYECGGAVVLEAMAMARPVIATAWGGPTDYLDSTCGFLVEPTGREALIAGFASAMCHLGESSDLRDRMGAAGRARLLLYFDWQRKIDRILEIYTQALSRQI